MKKGKAEKAMTKDGKGRYVPGAGEAGGPPREGAFVRLRRWFDS